MIEKDVRVIGNVEIGQNVDIGGPTELNGKNSRIVIGDGCDIASGVSVTTADSHMRCLGIRSENERREVIIENNVFIGQDAIILGGTHIGHHSVIGANIVLKGQHIPPYSRVHVQEPIIEPGYYAPRS